ncbi:MAG: hypothetical protein AAGI53_00475 [Planctomycetota bacterium]
MSSFTARWSLCLCVMTVLSIGLNGCVANKSFNPEPHQYLQTLSEPTDDALGVDLAIIEFDEFGMFWNRDQLESAIDLIRRRNDESERGIAVVTYVHGWMNNANPDREDGDLYRFRGDLANIATGLKAEDERAPDRVVGVYLAWRGATNRIPAWSALSFWDRKRTGERVASYQMRETLFRLVGAAKTREDSKVLLSGHSMGGMITARSLAPTISTLLLAAGPEGLFVPVDLVLLQNPALDALTTYQFIEFMKRTGTRAELVYEDGRTKPAPGPVIVAITSEADWVTRVAYRGGQILGNLSNDFRSDIGEGVPSQGDLSNRATGHSDFLTSHRAWLEDGEVKIEAVPDAYNDTPYWVVRVTEDICKNHGDIHNPRFTALLAKLTKLNEFYDTTVKTRLTQDPSQRPGG